MQSPSLPVLNKNISNRVTIYYFDDAGVNNHLPLQNDQQLITKSLSGNNLAFRQLLDRHLKAVYNFLYQLTKDPSSLDDLTQETFIKVWKNLSRFDQSKSFKVWVFTIAKNTAYDFLKKKKSIPFSSFEDEGDIILEELESVEPLPDEILERQDLENELRAKINKIPDHYRIILLLHYKDDFSLKEIAVILNKPYNTIKSRHLRGMQKLKSLLVDRI